MCDVCFLPTLCPFPFPTDHINQITISSSDHHEDLGVILTSNLYFSKHPHHIISKAYKTLGTIRRALKTKSTTAKRKLYLLLMRPQLTYCSPVWHPIFSRISQPLNEYNTMPLSVLPAITPLITNPNSHLFLLYSTSYVLPGAE